MTPDHYFTAQPASPDERRALRVRLAGRDVEVQVAPGTFSPGGLDRGTAVLLDEAPAPPESGTFLGLLSSAATVYAVDVNERALDLTARNAAALGLDGVRVSGPDGIPEGVEFDLIWSNPPIRVGKAALHEILATWLPRLRPDGRAELVVAKNLGADSLARWIETELGLTTECRATSRGFRVLTVSRPRDAVR